MAHVPTAAGGLKPDGAVGASAAESWRAIDWSAHQRWVEIDGRWANVISLGGDESASERESFGESARSHEPARGADAAPLLFVHGLSGCWQNWLEQLPVFAAERRVIAVDLPGFGASEMPQREISIPAYAHFLDRLLDELGVVGPVVVVGNSMGGFVAAELALAVPERVEKLVLVAAAGVSSDRAKRAPMVTGARALALVTAWAASRHEPFARRPRLRRLALRFVVRHPERLSAPLAYELMEGSGRPGFVPALDALLSYPLRDRLGEIVCPTLIVWGDRDQIVPVGDAHRFERLIPGSHKVILPDTGHVAMLERPLIFNGLLSSFLAE